MLKNFMKIFLKWAAAAFGLLVGGAAFFFLLLWIFYLWIANRM